MLRELPEFKNTLVSSLCQEQTHLNTDNSSKVKHPYQTYHKAAKLPAWPLINNDT